MKMRIAALLATLVLTMIAFYACQKEESLILEDLDYLEITPTSAFLLPGASQQFTATAYFLDGTNKDVTKEVEWKSNNTAVLTIDDKGVGKGVSKGHAFVVANAGLDFASTMASVVGDTEIDRQKIIQDFKDNYLGTEHSDVGWTGSVAGCNAGTITQITYEKVTRRVNYFRRLVGVHDNIVMKQEYSAKCQEAALMFKANNTISHYPPASWTCFTANGEEAAGKSNIAIGFHSVNAVSAYIDDFGANNKPVGHRRWILYSQANAIGEGSTPNTNALWIWDWLPSAPAGTPEFIAYPAKGYFPAPLVFDRWSFSKPNVNFTNASVSMKDASGANVTVDVIDKTTVGAGDNTIVWEPANINTSGPGDVKYTVTVSGLTGNPSSYTYDVVIVQPTTSKMMTSYQMEKARNPNARVE